VADDTNYSKREIDTFFMNQKESFDRLFTRMDNQDKTLSRIEINQNVNQLDIALVKDTIKDYGSLKEAVNSLTNYKWWIIGSIATFTALMTVVALLMNNQIDTKISVGIDSAFNTRFSKIQVINN
jgi:lysozyme family protein